MLLLKTIKDTHNQVIKSKSSGQKVGFVPTMGALHDGHISLISQSHRENDLTVCSIFVNPTQFNDPKDFEKYPVTLDSDMQKLLKARCDILFLPSVAEMYPKGLKHSAQIDFGYVATILEGEFRPGHFDGMAQIVEKLLLAVAPDRIYMGQKDYQQAMICRELIKKRKLKIQIEVCPIKREKDGLAMSSRNVRLDLKSRARAVEIVKTLKILKRQIASLTSQFTNEKPALAVNKIKEMEATARARLSAFPEFKVEYVAILDARTLKPISRFTSTTEAVALIAAQIGGVRLIDNMLL
jgi:pantoate--beta-alanine ligase